jgi:transcriptional regulator of arginine metabolism
MAFHLHDYFEDIKLELKINYDNVSECDRFLIKVVSKNLGDAMKGWLNVAGRDGSMNRRLRQRQIIDIIQESQVKSQDQLVQMLGALGYKITQSTISRDVRELNLSKIRVKSGKYIYATHKEVPDPNVKMKSVMANYELRFQQLDHLLLIKTISGCAQLVASLVDELKSPGIIGSIAGDDTILVVCNNNEAAKRLAGQFQSTSV